MEDGVGGAGDIGRPVRASGSPRAVGDDPLTGADRSHADADHSLADDHGDGHTRAVVLAGADADPAAGLDGIVAVVREATLVAVRAGYCTATASLAVEQIIVASRQGRFDLPGAVRFHGGVPLLRRPAPSA
ncbi:hypothetical protein [Streptacidiphilus sp. EB129]|uniref:hypothetical protein n=1 Tax=Streptacidiphilus sp. EB129 TaxID=3156262 RepID=UPI0035160D06